MGEIIGELLLKLMDQSFWERVAPGITIGKEPSQKDKQEIYNKIITPFLEKLIKLCETLPDAMFVGEKSKKEILRELKNQITNTKAEFGL